MANDRLILKCKTCGEEMLIAKHFGDPWDMRNVEAVPEFMLNHNLLCFYDNPADSNNQFQIYAEMDNIQ